MLKYINGKYIQIWRTLKQFNNLYNSEPTKNSLASQEKIDHWINHVKVSFCIRETSLFFVECLQLFVWFHQNYNWMTWAANLRFKNKEQWAECKNVNRGIQCLESHFLRLFGNFNTNDWEEYVIASVAFCFYLKLIYSLLR